MSALQYANDTSSGFIGHKVNNFRPIKPRERWSGKDMENSESSIYCSQPSPLVRPI